MSRDLAYGKEKFRKAVKILSGRESPQVRLRLAFQYELHLLDSLNLSTDLWSEFVSIKNRVTRSKDTAVNEREGLISAVCAKLSDSEANELIERLLSIAKRV